MFFIQLEMLKMIKKYCLLLIHENLMHWQIELFMNCNQLWYSGTNSFSGKKRILGNTLQ